MLKDTIKSLAAGKGMSLRDVAEKSGVPYSAIAEWNTSIPNAVALLRVCKVLGTTVEEVIGGDS